MLSGHSFIPPIVRQAVILCHGYGSNGADMAGLFPTFSKSLPNTAFFAPNAPVQQSLDGYEWFSLDDYLSCDQATPEYLSRLMDRCQKPAEELRGFMNLIKDKYSLTDQNLILGGFSQGGLMAVYTGLTNPAAIAGMIGFSAVPVLFSDTTGLHPAPVLLTHGSNDDVIPVQGLTFNENELQRVGCKVQTFISTGLTHAIDSDCMDAAVRFMQSALHTK